MSFEVLNFNSSTHLVGTSSHRQNGRGFNPSSRYPWKEEYLGTALSFLTKKNSLGVSWVNCEHLIQDFPPEIRYPIYDFCLALQGYQDSSSKAMDPDNIWLNCFYGPGYAKTLKRLKAVSFLTSVDAKTIGPNPEYKKISPIPIKDIGDIFNYRYLIPWQEPESNDLNDFSFKEPLYPLDEELLEEFAYAVRYELEQVPLEKVKVIPKQEILLETSTSTTFAGLPNAVEKQMSPYNNYMATSLSNLRHQSLQKGPGETRDIVLLSVAESNLIKWIDKQTLEIIQHHPWSAHTKDPAKFKKVFDRIASGSTFYCRDIEKEGLTKPHILLEIMLRELRDYSGFGCYENENVFNQIRIDGKELIRGHGLGMANALTTLMQIAIHSINIDKVKKESPDIKTSQGYLNDDSAVSFQNRSDAELYIEADFDTCNALGIAAKDSKSFQSNFGFVLCENYYWRSHPEISDKDSYYRYIAMKPLNAVNIVHAKDKAASASCPGRYIDLYKDLYLQKWGYEFFPEEGQLPRCFGGWSSFHYGATSMDLYMAAETRHCIRLLDRVFTACLVAPRIPNFATKRTVQKMEKLGLNTSFFSLIESVGGPSPLGVTNIPATLEQVIAESIQWRTNPKAYAWMWNDLMARRKKTWDKFSGPSLSVEDGFVKFKTKLPIFDFVPPRPLWMGTAQKTEGERPYVYPYESKYPNINIGCLEGSRPYGFISPCFLDIYRRSRGFKPPDPFENAAWFNISPIGWLLGQESVVINSSCPETDSYYINAPEVYHIMACLGVHFNAPIAYRWEHPLKDLKLEAWQQDLDLSQLELLPENESELELIRTVSRLVKTLDEPLLNDIREMIDESGPEVFQIKDAPSLKEEEPQKHGFKTEEEISWFEHACTTVYRTMMQRAQFRGIGFSAFTQSVDVSDYDYQPAFAMVAEIREEMKVRLSAEAYNSWIESTKVPGWEGFLLDLESDSEDPNYGGIFDLE